MAASGSELVTLTQLFEVRNDILATTWNKGTADIGPIIEIDPEISNTNSLTLDSFDDYIAQSNFIIEYVQPVIKSGSGLLQITRPSDKCVVNFSKLIRFGSSNYTFEFIPINGTIDYSNLYLQVGYAYLIIPMQPPIIGTE